MYCCTIASVLYILTPAKGWIRHSPLYQSKDLWEVEVAAAEAELSSLASAVAVEAS